MRTIKGIENAANEYGQQESKMKSKKGSINHATGISYKNASWNIMNGNGLVEFDTIVAEVKEIYNSC